MYESMLCDVIVDAFSHAVGGKGARNEEGHLKALKVGFRVNSDYDAEEGYRQMELLVFAPMNYVAVLARHRWNVVPIEGIDTDTEDGGLRPGYDYVRGEGEWAKLTYHDSGWRSTIDDFLREHSRQISGFDSGDRWYEIKPLSLDEEERLMALPLEKLKAAPKAIDLYASAPKPTKPRKPGR